MCRTRTEPELCSLCSRGVRNGGMIVHNKINNIIVSGEAILNAEYSGKPLGAVGAPPRTPLWELSALPRPNSWWGGDWYLLPKNPAPAVGLSKSCSGREIGFAVVYVQLSHGFCGAHIVPRRSNKSARHPANAVRFSSFDCHANRPADRLKCNR